MRLGTILMICGVAAIPLWYAYRTVTELRVRHLEWNEIFMTEEQRQKKWAEEKQQAKDAAEAERVAKVTEMEKATAARKVAEAEAAKAEAIVMEKHAMETAEADRRRGEVERKSAEQESARAKAEGARALFQRAFAARVQICGDRAKEAESRLRDFSAEQNSYRTYVDSVFQLRFDLGPSRTPNLSPELVKILPPAALANVIASYVPPDEITPTLRMLFQRKLLNTENPAEIQRAKEDCEKEARETIALVNDYQLDFSLRHVESLTSSYEESLRKLKASRSDIQDLVDYATGKLPDTFGGRAKAERVKVLIQRAHSYKEPE
jgi:hypothetical protein